MGAGGRFNATYPTFICGDVVVKLFGYSRSWRASHAAERAAQALVATDPEVLAARRGALMRRRRCPMALPAYHTSARGRSLPPHLVAQVDDYLARLGAIDRVFVHGDLCANHVYVENGGLAGIIDWHTR